MRCICCKADEDLRMGICFDCATAGEERALKRTVVQHVGKAIKHAIKGRWTNARIDCSWAWERLTRNGDYAPGGYAERALRG